MCTTLRATSVVLVVHAAPFFSSLFHLSILLMTWNIRILTHMQKLLAINCRTDEKPHYLHFSKIGFFIWSDSQKSPLFNGKKIILIEQIEFEIRLPIQQVSCIRSEKMRKKQRNAYYLHFFADSAVFHLYSRGRKIEEYRKLLPMYIVRFLICTQEVEIMENTGNFCLSAK